MKTLVTTQIAQKYASNRAYILKVGKLTETEYNDFWHELGCAFLELIYDRKRNNEWYMIHAGSKRYWQWFKAEFGKWENEFMSYVSDNYFQPNLLLMQEELAQMIHTSQMENSFHHSYLKFCNLP